tara:strand:+ start:104 stop:406 length:303 start_codon:yes stop_codon:yes gene_type:complete
MDKKQINKEVLDKEVRELAARFTKHSQLPINPKDRDERDSVIKELRNIKREWSRLHDLDRAGAFMNKQSVLTMIVLNRRLTMVGAGTLFATAWVNIPELD